MKKLRLALVLLVFFHSSSIFAQSDDEAAKERTRQQNALIEAIIAETRDLRLPENRAWMLAKAGHRLWAIDQERARDLFNEAVNELISAIAQAEMEKRRNPHLALNIAQQMPRHSVLSTIGQRDAELALASFYRTRPNDVEQAMAGRPPNDQRIRNIGNNEAYVVMNEINLEQMLIRMAADQNPEKSVELLRIALKRGVGPEVLNLLRKLHEKDPESATTLGREAIGQLMNRSFTVGNQADHNSYQAAFSILSDHIRQRPATDKSFRFTTADIRSLFDKVNSVILDPRNPMGFQYSRQLVPIAEKIRPDAVPRLQQAQQRAPYAPFQPQNADTVRRLTSTDTPVEQAMAEAVKLDPDARRQVYQSVANRLTAGGDLARARQILQENFADGVLSLAQEALDQQYVQYLINQGKFGEAEALIDEFSDPFRFQALISLADGAFSRDQKENHTFSIRILQRARAILPERPETNQEMNQLMRLVNAYVRIEPAEAFHLIDGLILQINEISEASAVVNGFQGSSIVRKGEYVFHVGGGQSAASGIDFSAFRGLAQKDFDRTLGIIRSFSRREARTQLTLNLLESYPQSR
ncbi:MAG TPA: hypothetical protein PKD26_09335 [Pyrinomonadaceae bacterium]|nr:hypothetical protein [Pyrinomonadaceae bacterium]